MSRSRWFIKTTEIRRAKEFRKLRKACRETYLAKRRGEQ